MLLRFFTFLLFLTMLFPAGVFGAVSHRCGMEKSVSRMSCCQGVENTRLAHDGIDQLMHHCQREASQAPFQLATVSQKVQPDAAHLADITVNTLLSLRPSQGAYNSFHRLDISYLPGESAPVFLRICSFLI